MKKRRMRRRGDAGKWTIKLAQIGAREASRRRRRKHPLRGTWLRIVRASRNPDPNARVPAPQRWLDFAQFVRDVGARPEGCRLVRPFGNLGWRPTNAVWVRVADVRGEGIRYAARVLGISRLEAQEIEHRLAEHPIPEIPVTGEADWGGLRQRARDTGVKYHTLMKRLERGWTLERALVPPQRVVTGTEPARSVQGEVTNTKSVPSE